MRALAAVREALSLVDGLAAHGLRTIVKDGATLLEMDLDLWHPSLHLDRRVHRIDVAEGLALDELERSGMETALAREMVRDVVQGISTTPDHADVVRRSMARMDDDAVVLVARRHAERLVGWQASRARAAARLGIDTPIPVFAVKDETETETLRRIGIGHLSIEGLCLETLLANLGPAAVILAIRRVVYECIDPHGIDPHGVAGAVDDGNTMRAFNPRIDDCDWLVGPGPRVSFPIDVRYMFVDDQTTVSYHAGVVGIRDNPVPDTVVATLRGRPLSALVEVPGVLGARTILRVEEDDEEMRVGVAPGEDVLLRDHPALRTALGEA
jgi:hypothetical protein